MISNTNTKKTSPSSFTYTVVRSDDEANAFVLPGNHIFVLTGLFRYARNEDDLAAILGHEMAHNVARHIGEKLSDTLLLQLLATLLCLSVDSSGTLSSIFLPAANVLYGLPNSREAESEADRIGIELAARACYDPRAAKRVFLAMKQEEDGLSSRIPEYLSTHPSHDCRISQLDDWLPQAIRTYKGDDYFGAPHRCQQVREDMAQARQAAAIA
eukprot:CAMPEP_0194176554 /NCGR_PEP_ID=MMETSP0154-20130528/10453_1 /TAXON_ID=1049557 /ORGANISM="Thalassiothrix antarctica, Strain L6-D1" /LENGTH=212 /DNA_ID=CAMNT_0038890781 /DNA_START=196 /DNA_END=831 /DNA_ORIENTATION=+